MKEEFLKALADNDLMFCDNNSPKPKGSVNVIILIESCY